MYNSADVSIFWSSDPLDFSFQGCPCGHVRKQVDRKTVINGICFSLVQVNSFHADRKNVGSRFEQ